MRRIIKGDKVRIISGKYKSKEGAVLSVDIKTNTAIVEGINIMKRHQKAGKDNNDKGTIVSKECPINLSKIAILDPKSKNGIAKICFKVENGKKVRISRKSKNVYSQGGKK